MIRVYSKPLPGDKSQFFTRVEIELKKAAAQQVWDKFIKDPPTPLLKDLLAIMRTVVTEFKTDTIDRVFLEAGQFEFSRRETTDTTWQEWLSRQVVPSLKADYKLGARSSRKLEWLINEVTGIEVRKLDPRSYDVINQDVDQAMD